MTLGNHDSDNTDIQCHLSDTHVGYKDLQLLQKARYHIQNSDIFGGKFTELCDAEIDDEGTHHGHLQLFPQGTVSGLNNSKITNCQNFEFELNFDFE